MSQSTSALHYLSFKQKPRIGQKEVFDEVLNVKQLNIQLPTGYGKTYASLGTYSILKHAGKVNRLLTIFPTDAQLMQFYEDAKQDLLIVNEHGNSRVVDIRDNTVKAVKRHQRNEAQLYVITIQSLIQTRGMDAVQKLLEKGNWMITVDEYHHYGDGKSWGEAVKNLNCEFRLAMSATPFRAGDDNVLGAPSVNMQYRVAVNEKAVKPLQGHSYHYLIDAIDENGELHTYTTEDLIEEAGGDAPEEIEKFRVRKRMRWSPKYVSPLIDTPIARMKQQRVATGQKHLQVLIGALCVSHAEMVCEQVRVQFPDLRVDWVGTFNGTHGRTKEENKKVLSAFCPKKNPEGKREPTLDVLVHVGMAGEGLDSVHVSEVIHLNPANKNNSNDQENGRAARYLKNLHNGEAVTGYINFDATSEYATMGFIYDAIMDAMDGNTPSEKEEGDGDGGTGGGGGGIPEMPDNPVLIISKADLTHIDGDTPEVKRMAKVLQDLGVTGIDYSVLISDPNGEEMQKVISVFEAKRLKEMNELNEKSEMKQWQDSVKTIVDVTVRRVIRSASRGGLRADRSLAGDIAKRINSRKKECCGAISKDVDVYKKHYTWMRNLEKQILNGGTPSWLL